MYTLLVAEDEQLMRQGIISLIDFDKLGIRAVYEATNGQDALAIVETKKPDIILADINMPYLDGLSFAKQAKLLQPETRIVFVTGYDYFDYALVALKLGADDYVLKPVSKQDIEELLVNVIKKLQISRRAKSLETLLVQQHGEHSPDEMSSQIRQLIAQKLNEPSLSLTWLASELGFNPSYLSSIVKKVLGISFQDYVTQERIEQAKVLLLATNLKNYQIAEQIGFEDVNYFSLRFKQRTGYSPKQYKRKAEEQHEN